MAQQLQRPVRETVTPAVLQKTVWAGANLKSFPQGSEALRVLAEVALTAKQVRRITEQFGQDRLAERLRQVADFQEKPLMQRLTAAADIDRPPLGVVMMDGGRYQRRDHFGEVNYDGSHWKEDKVGIVLHMDSQVHDRDPHPEFPEWLVSAEVIAELAALGRPPEEQDAPRQTRFADAAAAFEQDEAASHWELLTPRRLSRDVIASSQSGEDFGHHLEFAAWQRGVVDAPRMAFVADGASVNWTIHKRHFSQMSGILDLMHALSYAWKAARALEDPAAYQRYATWIWQGNVPQVIQELTQRETARTCDAPDAPEHSRTDDSVQRAITYFTHHQPRMNYPRYRQQGLPLTSSHIESTIKQINLRVKGSEKFFRRETGETLLQLRADSLSDSQPLTPFWQRWHQRQTGANTYRKQAT